MLSRGENQLLKIQTISSFAGALSGIFLQIYLFKLSGFRGAVLYNIAMYASLFIFFVSSGFLLRRYSSRTLMRAGLLLFSLSWAIILILKEDSVNHLILLGMLFGMGNGWYWSGFNLSQYILTHEKSRGFYFGKGNALINIAKAVAPGLAGLIILAGNSLVRITLGGYYFLFFVVFCLEWYCLAKSSGLPRHSGVRFSLKHILNHKLTRNWKLVLCQQFTLGLWDSSIANLTPILLFLIMGSEVALGSVNSVFALLAAVTSYIGGRMLGKQPKLYRLGAIGTVLGILAFAGLQNWTGIILFGLLTGLATPLLSIPLSVAILNTIDETKEPWQEKYHLFLERDGILGLARILSYGILFLLFTRFDRIMVVRNWLIVIAIFPLILGVLLEKMKIRVEN